MPERIFIPTVKQKYYNRHFEHSPFGATVREDPVSGILLPL